MREAGTARGAGAGPGGPPAPTAAEARLGAPPPAVRVDFAGVVVEFAAEDDRSRDELERRFAGFLTGRPAAFRVRRRAGSTEAAASDGGATFAAREIDVAKGHAIVPSTATPEQMGFTVRAALPGLLADGFVAHAAVLVDGDRGFLCCGASGAGKSTLAELAAERAGCEESAAVKRQGAAWTVQSLPFRRARPAIARLAGVYLLRHAARNLKRRLAPGDAVARLSRHVFWPESAPAETARVLGLVADLAERVPVWELGFVPTTAAVDLVFAGTSGGEGAGDETCRT